MQRGPGIFPVSCWRRWPRPPWLSVAECAEAHILLTQRHINTLCRQRVKITLSLEKLMGCQMIQISPLFPKRKQTKNEPGPFVCPTDDISSDASRVEGTHRSFLVLRVR